MDILNTRLLLKTMNKQDIEDKLNRLRQKWIGHVPKNDSEPDTGHKRNCSANLW